MSSSSYMKFYQEFLQRKSAFANSEKEEEPPSSEKCPKLHSTGDQNKEEIKLTVEDQLESRSSDMEHSYTRDVRPLPVLTGLTPARTLLVRRPPQCPSCHAHPMDENNEMDDANQPVIPTYNETASKDAMNECSRIAKTVKNLNADDQNWEERVSQNGWTSMQVKLFNKVVNTLDVDQLGRLANAGRQHEPIQRRVVIDKSVQRFRKALATVSWDPRLTQWLHGLLMECLPPSYMASYLDILQTLKSKLPTLIDKMLFGRPMNISQDLLAPVLKKQWEPIIMTQQKTRKLPQPAVIIALPSMPVSGPVPNRIQKWYQHLATITQIVQVTLPSGSSMTKQPLESIAEQIVSLTRLKIQELRNEQPTRSIILIGFNAGASLALQVAMVETISSVVCMGLAFNTLVGVRGAPDDRILDIKAPILFVVGQNAARSSQEEMESLREKMQSDSAMVVVGSADDVLRVPKSKRKIENITQNMIDTMVIDEIYEFVKKILLNPPGPRTPLVNNQSQTSNKKIAAEVQISQRKRKQGTTDTGPTPAKLKSGIKNANGSSIHNPGQKYQRKPKPPKDSFPIKRKVGRPRTRPLPEIVSASQSTPVKQQIKQQIIAQPSNDDLNLAIQSILGDGDTPTKTNDDARSEVTNYEIVTQPKAAHLKTILASCLRTAGQPLSLGTGTGTKIKMIPSNQIVQLKPPMQSQTKIYTIKPTSMVASSSTSTPTVSGSQIFTIKPNVPGSQTQIVTVGNQPKFTILKTSPIKSAVTSTSTTTSRSSGNDDLSNIFDMPIIFADNEGNLTETVSIPKVPASTQSPIILTPSSATSSKGGTYVINASALQHQQQQKSKPNKVVFINRNTMKPCPNIISRSTNVPQLQKYTKVVVTNPKTSATTLVARPAQQQLIKPSDKVIKQLNLHALKSTASVSTSTTSAPTILNMKQFHIVNMDPEKQKLIKTATTSASTTLTNDATQSVKNTIVIKPGGLKQLPGLLKPQVLHRNVTLHKLMNIVPTAKTSGVITTTVSQLQSGAAGTSVATAVSSGSIVTPTTTTSMTKSRSPSS